MSRKARGPSGHAGQTQAGNVRDVKVERIGPVTIYKRGLSYFLYYREKGVSRRTKVDGNLAVAHATASTISSALANHRPSPLSHQRTSPQEMVAAFLDYVSSVQKLALSTHDRYRAALDRFLVFCKDGGIAVVDTVDETTVENFVRWLRGQTRTRNGSAKGKRGAYKLGGVKFILSTCRTAFNWAGRRRMLPPFTENPFRSFPIDKLRDRVEESGESRLFSTAQERAFFEACSDWQLRGVVGRKSSLNSPARLPASSARCMGGSHASSQKRISGSRTTWTCSARIAVSSRGAGRTPNRSLQRTRSAGR